MKTVLVTGACGGVGKFICIQLLQKNDQVYGLDNKKGALPPEMHFILCDVTDVLQTAVIKRILRT